MPDALTWLFSADVVGFTTTSNCTVKESPVFRIVPDAPELSINSVVAVPSHALSIATIESGSVGPAVTVRLLALTNAAPY